MSLRQAEGIAFSSTQSGVRRQVQFLHWTIQASQDCPTHTRLEAQAWRALYSQTQTLSLSEDQSHTVVVWDLRVPHISGIVRVPGIEWTGKVPKGLGQETSAGIVGWKERVETQVIPRTQHMAACQREGCLTQYLREKPNHSQPSPGTCTEA